VCWLFPGEHDWTAFSAAQSDAESRVRTIESLEIAGGWNARGRCHLIEMTVSANGFLRYMVRSIAGTLLAAGRGEVARKLWLGQFAKAIAHWWVPPRRRMA